MKYFYTITVLFFLISFQVQAQKGENANELIRKGARLHDRGFYIEAISSYKEALRLNPNSMSAIYEMSLSYLKLKDYENAMKYSSRVIDARFQHLLVDAYTVKGTALIDAGRRKDAIGLFHNAIIECGDEYLLHYNLGLSYYKDGSRELAIYHLRKAITMDATKPDAFLLYGYLLNDEGVWIESFYAFHFFLLLEPNTERSKSVCEGMKNMFLKDIPSAKLTSKDGLDRKMLYFKIKERSKSLRDYDSVSQYNYFRDISLMIFKTLTEAQKPSNNGILWEFFVPTYQEIEKSGFFETYCRYVSSSYFNESLNWWNTHKEDVDKFIDWFEQGQDINEESEMGEDADFGDEENI